MKRHPTMAAENPLCDPARAAPPAALPPAEGDIRVRGARVHNLKNLDVDIPLGRLTVVTGVSGSGKSSLAFETLYAEGQRRYVESLSAYARQFLERLEKPDADSIEGIAPAIAIRQKNTSRNPRSTVATATELYDYLRLLYARAGRTICPQCRIEAKRDSVDEAVEALLALHPGRRAYLLFPLGAEAAPPPPPVRRRKTAAPPLPAEAWKQRLAQLRAQGFHRLYQAGRLAEFATPESLLELDFSQPVWVVADRMTLAAENRSQLAEAVEAAYREAGELRAEVLAGEGAAPAALRFSERFECKQCGRKFAAPQPRIFSFNHPAGACQRCQGFGNTMDYDLKKVVPNPELSLDEGAIVPWTKPRYRGWARALREAARAAQVPLDRPWRRLSAAQQRLALEGDGDFSGVRGFFEHLERKKYKLHVRVFLSRFRGYARCDVCQGFRLRPEALWIELPDPVAEPRWQGWHIGRLAALTVSAARQFFARLRLSPAEAELAAPLLEEINQRLEFLDKVGLHYLTLDRLASSLSGGEAQRIQLATCLGSHLVGALYVLDEPSIGLHSRDTGRLIGIMQRLRDEGNTILVVEHDAQIMRASDHLLDLGPGAGEHGGQLIAQGDWRQVRGAPQSRTGRYLAGRLKLPEHAQRQPRPGIRVLGAARNNLQQLDAEFPLGILLAVTGVSGSGKSTLVHQVLYANLHRLRQNPHAELIGCRAIEGWERLREVHLVDQSPIGRTPRSNPVTYAGAYDGIRGVFAQTPEARRLGLKPGHFSFNVAGGRCETCRGAGTVTVEMQFLADVELPCETCQGTRFKPEVLQARFHGHNIAETLQLTVEEALRVFAGHKRILQPLRQLTEVGLGYLRLGQPATTLSGGEAQRLKLAAHLAAAGELRDALFLFDEPTTGLHFDDIAQLLRAFDRLIDGGASVVVIEHNLDLIAAADLVLDLGPEGGEAGGRVVAQGTPEEVSRINSATGLALAEQLRGAGTARETAPAAAVQGK